MSDDELKELISNMTSASNSTMSLSAFRAEVTAKRIIQNLCEYNVIIGMTEDMKSSLDILRHVFLGRNSSMARAEGIFSASGKRVNVSSKGEVSTSAVIEELSKDENFMFLFEEYVKYERMVSDFAWGMHNLQYSMTLI